MIQRAVAPLLALAALLGGCCTPERVILLPQADGRPTAVITHIDGQPESKGVILAQPYAEARSDGKQLTLGQTQPDAVKRDFGALMAFQPARPRLFTVNFLSNSNQLTPETEPVLEQVRQSLAQYPAGEIIVIGHTDSVGAMETNDALSLKRAEVVAELLVKMGVPDSQVQRVGRGEREPLVPTADEVDEPRNRRVEIKLR